MIFIVYHNNEIFYHLLQFDALYIIYCIELLYTMCHSIQDAILILINDYTFIHKMIKEVS